MNIRELHSILPIAQNSEETDILIRALSDGFVNGIAIRRVNFVDSQGKKIVMGGMVKHQLSKFLPVDEPFVVNGNEFVSRCSGMLQELKRSNCFKGAVIKKQLSDEKEDFFDLDVVLDRKSLYHFAYSQNFNREGNLTLSYSGGFRNILGSFESINYSYEKSLQGDKLTTRSIDINFPLFWNNTKFNLGYFDGSASIGQKVIERKTAYSGALTFPFRDFTVSVSKEKRRNVFNPDDVSLDILVNQIIPTNIVKTACELSVLKYAFGPFQTNGKIKASKIYGDAEYVDFEFGNSMKIALSSILGVFTDKDKFKDLTLESSTKCKLLLETNSTKPAKINDLKHLNNLRGFDAVGYREAAFNVSRHPFHSTKGFQHLGAHLGGNFTLENSSKLVFNSYPFLGKTSPIRTFLHHSMYYNTYKTAGGGFCSDALNRSSGLGLAYSPGGASLEFLYNFWHSSIESTKPSHFQFRISFDD